MTTRADFYIVDGKQWEPTYLGSVQSDGFPETEHPQGVPRSLLEAKKYSYIEEVRKLIFQKRLEDRDSATFGEDGWPWRSETSQKSDYTYAFFGGRVWYARFGLGWYDPFKNSDEPDLPRQIVFPVMKTKSPHIAERGVAYGNPEYFHHS